MDLLGFKHILGLTSFAPTDLFCVHCSIIGFGTALFHLLKWNSGAVCLALFHLCLWNTVPSLVLERRCSITGEVCLVRNAGAVPSVRKERWCCLPVGKLALFHVLEWNTGAVCLWEKFLRRLNPVQGGGRVCGGGGTN